MSRSPFGWTGRALGLLLAALALWLLGRVLGVRELWMAALACVLLPVLGAVYVRSAGASLAAERIGTPGQLPFGAEGATTVELVATGRVPTSRTLVTDAVSGGIAAPTAVTVPPLPPGGRAHVTTALVARARGVHELGPVTVTVRDPFATARRSVRLDAPGRVVVPPRVVPLAAGLPISGHDDGGGATRARRGRTGEDVTGVRSYVRGDDLRRVHWRATAHRGELMVRETERATRPAATVVVDVRQDAHVGTGPQASIETAVTAAASLAGYAAERGVDPVLVTAPQDLVASRHDAGWQPLLRRLAELVVDPDADLSTVWAQLALGAGPPGALLAVVAPPTTELLELMVRAGRGSSPRVALVLDTAAHPGARRHRPPEPTTAVASLRSAGWRAAVLVDADHLQTVWRELTSRRPVRT